MKIKFQKEVYLNKDISEIELKDKKRGRIVLFFKDNTHINIYKHKDNDFYNKLMEILETEKSLQKDILENKKKKDLEEIRIKAENKQKKLAAKKELEIKKHIEKMETKENELNSILTQETFENIIDIEYEINNRENSLYKVEYKKKSMNDKYFKFPHNSIFKCHFDDLSYDCNLIIQNGISLCNFVPYAWNLFTKELKKNVNKCEICNRELGKDFSRLEAHELLGISINGDDLITYILDIKLLCPDCHKIYHYQFAEILVAEGKVPDDYLDYQFRHYQNVTKDYSTSRDKLIERAQDRNVEIKVLLKNCSYMKDVNKLNKRICLLDSYRNISTEKIKTALYKKDLLYKQDIKNEDGGYILVEIEKLRNPSVFDFYGIY